MNRFEFEYLVGHPVPDDDFRKSELVCMNTAAIIGTGQMARIYREWGMEAVDILYSLVDERGELIGTVGDLRMELSDTKKENRRLREFREVILKAYKEAENDA